MERGWVTKYFRGNSTSVSLNVMIFKYIMSKCSVILSVGKRLTLSSKIFPIGFGNKALDLIAPVSHLSLLSSLFEPPYGKTNNLHRQKQRRRSASQ